MNLFQKMRVERGLTPDPTPEELSAAARRHEARRRLSSEERRQYDIAEMEAAGHDASHLRNLEGPYGAQVHENREDRF